MMLLTSQECYRLGVESNKKGTQADLSNPYLFLQYHLPPHYPTAILAQVYTYTHILPICSSHTTGIPLCFCKRLFPSTVHQTKCDTFVSSQTKHHLLRNAFPDLLLYPSSQYLMFPYIITLKK